MRVYYESYGDGDQAILLMPWWEIVHSRAWRAQIPYLARHARVITFDPRGNGRSDRPADVRAYDRRARAGDALAVLDQLGIDRAVVAWCGAGEQLVLAAEHPERVTGLVMTAPDLQVSEEPAEAEGPYSFDDELETEDGWAKWNRHY
ncbi:MAG: alpha/beta fold hydrolase [Streptosporangiaceae bacterium]